MAAQTDQDLNFYHRRMDRSPEKGEFKHLPREDRQLIGQLRSAMEGTREKVTTLRDEIEDRDRDITREAALRRAAEERLEQLVDMYGDPAVMEELRERLPRAGRRPDPKKQWQAELEQIKAQDAAQTTHTSRVGHDTLDETDDPTGVKARRSRSAESRRKRAGDSLESERDSRRRQHSHSPPPGSASHHHPPYPAGGYPGGAYAPGPYSHGAGFGGQPYPVYYPPPPMYQHPQVIYASPSQGAMNAPMAMSTPVSGATGGAPMQVLAFPSNHSGLLSVQPGHSTSQLEGATGGAAASTTTTSTTTTVGTAGRSRDEATAREQTRQISLLLAELDKAKDTNRQLQAKLNDTEKELESLKISQKTAEAEKQAEISTKAAELVEEIYRAQKQRDEAMLGRLRLANEERDEVLVKYKNMQQTLDGFDVEYEDLDGDLDLKQVLGSMEQADPAGIQKSGKHLVDAINATRRRRRTVTTEEMRAVLEERDRAVMQSQKLEGELVRAQRQLRARGSEKQQTTTNQAKLLATQQERDMALTKAKKLEDELQTLRLYYSLHKSLSQEANLRDQFNNTLENYEGQLKQREEHVSAAQQENVSLLSQLKAALADKAVLQDAVVSAQTAQKQAEDNQAKLERLVNVLRRKVNGLGSKSED